MTLSKALIILSLALNCLAFELPQDEQEISRGHGRGRHGHHGHHGRGHGHNSGPFPMGPPFPSPLERGHNRHRGPPPPPPFLRNITDQARREYFDIQLKPNATKAEVNQELEGWATRNGVMDQYANFTITLKNFAQKYHDLAVINLAGDALELYNKLWEIRQDEQITGSEECEQIKNALIKTIADFDFVIHSFLPPPINIGKCPEQKHKQKPHHRRPPFSENSSSSEGNGNDMHENSFSKGFGGQRGEPQNNNVDQQPQLGSQDQL
jgi:hypothetical protein